MSEIICTNCLKPKASFKCGICQNPLCKKCVQFVESDQFIYLQDIPKELTHGSYCGPCMDQTVGLQITSYQQDVALAKKVLIFLAEHANETRRFKRESKPVNVDNCTDNEHTLMSLALLAVRDGCNTLVDVETSSVKVDLGGYQTSKWKGRGVPVKLDGYVPNRKARIMGKVPDKD